MLRHLGLMNFKCFSSLDIDLSALTLLCGLNSMGKSTVIQSLLVLRQSYLSGDLLDGRLVLGGDLADLGTGIDVLYEDASTDELRFELIDDRIKQPWECEFKYSRTADKLVAIPVRNRRARLLIGRQWEKVPPFGDKTIYITAERIGPRKHHVWSESYARRGDLGSRGEHAMAFINENELYVFDDNDKRASWNGAEEID